MSRKKNARDLLKERIRETRIRPHDFLIDDAIDKSESENEDIDRDHNEYRDKLVDKFEDTAVSKTFTGDETNDRDGDSFGDQSSTGDKDIAVPKSFAENESDDRAKDKDNFVRLDGDKVVDKDKDRVRYSIKDRDRLGNDSKDRAGDRNIAGNELKASDGENFVPINSENFGDKSSSGDEETVVFESFGENESGDRVQDEDNFPNKSRADLQDEFVDPVILDEMKKKLRQSISYKRRRTHEETYKKLSVRVYKHLHDLFYAEAAARGGRGAVQELANEILTFWYKNKHKL